MGPTLSYVVTTRNKLPFLQESMKWLLSRVKGDEEIVVSDGESTDGTTEYLRGLLAEGRIQTLVSERDYGESHGWNKGLIKARGELIKLVSDDDAYCFDCIERCVRFMESHPDVHVLSANMGYVELGDPTNVRVRPEPQRDYEEWLRNRRRPFWFNGLPLMLRRSALPLTGLMHTGLECPDTEFSLRITSLPNLTLAWYTGVVCIRIDNPGSKYQRLREAVARDSLRVLRFYIDRKAPSYVTRVGLAGRRLGSRLLGSLRSGLPRRGHIGGAPPSATAAPTAELIAHTFRTCSEWLRRADECSPAEILHDPGLADG